MQTTVIVHSRQRRLPISERNLGFYIDLEDGLPALSWKLLSDHIKPIRENLSAVITGHFQVVDQGGGPVLLFVTTINDDVAEPYRIFTILNYQQRTAWLAALQSSSVTATVFDYASRQRLSLVLDIKADASALFWLHGPFVPCDEHRQQILTVEVARMEVANDLAVARPRTWFRPRKGTMNVHPIGRSRNAPVLGRPIGEYGKDMSPGSEFEFDVCLMLAHLFPPDHVLMNPSRPTKNNNEVCDILVATAENILVVFCKRQEPRPIDDRLYETQARRRERALKSDIGKIGRIYKDLTTGAISAKLLLENGDERIARLRDADLAGSLPYALREDRFEIARDGRRLSFLILAPEINPESLERLSEEVVEAGSRAASPVAVWDAPTLHALTRAASSTADFFAAIEEHWEATKRGTCQSPTYFPRGGLA